MGRGARRKIVQNAIFQGKRHDNKILKVRILLSRNFVVMAQAPKLLKPSRLITQALIIPGGRLCMRKMRPTTASNVTSHLVSNLQAAFLAS